MPSERLSMAEELSRLFVRRHGAEVVATGVHGSVARGDDSAASDIDFVVVARDASGAAKMLSRVLRYRGVTVDLGVTTELDYLAEAGSLGTKWPLAAEQYLVHRALYDPADFFGRLRTTHQRLITDTPSDVFAAACAPHAIAALDHIAEAQADVARHTHAAAYRCATESAVAASIAFGFLQRRYFRNTRHALSELPALAGLPSKESSSSDRSSHDATAYVSHVAEIVARLRESALQRGVELEASSLERFVDKGEADAGP